MSYSHKNSINNTMFPVLLHSPTLEVAMEGDSELLGSCLITVRVIQSPADAIRGTVRQQSNSPVRVSFT